MVIGPQKEGKESGKISPVYSFTLISLCTGLLVVLCHVTVLSQCPTSQELYNKLLILEKDNDLSPVKKLTQAFSLQKAFDGCRLKKDSVYARLLHRIGVWEFSTGKPNEAISHTLASVKINTSGKKESNRRLAVNSYYNLGYYFDDLNRYKDALDYSDLCIVTGSSYKDSLTLVFVINARNRKAYIYYQTGDYQKAIEEAALGLKTAAFIKNPALALNLLNEQAKAYAAVQQINEAVIAVNKAAAIISKDDYDATANNYKIKATISEAAGNYTEATSYHRKAIVARSRTGDMAALADDYLDAGNTLRKEAITKNTGNLSKAKSYYTLSLLLAQKGGKEVTTAKALNNLAIISFRTKKYSYALIGYHNSLQQTVAPFRNSNALYNPTYRQCNAISDKNFLSLLLANKAECLLCLYKQTGSRQYLTAAHATAKLTDSLITDMRHEQTGEQSKLYWRNETREFFTNAIEASYQAKDAKLAFFFMEKSRAVLLNDKLNELGASAHLPPEEAHKEQAMQINVLALQQQLAQLVDTDPAFEEQQVKLLEAKEDLDNYIKKLQNKYPAYYQYKYADDVPKLDALQKYLYLNKQSFVHYFITDTTMYMLGITASSTKLIKLNRQEFNTELSQFLKICSDKQALNNHYDSFALLSHKIYNALFKPLDLPKGRVIICYDNFLIPFEALTTDEKGKDFLINNYTFSYIYSARFLLKKFNNPRGKGNFLGVAPVSYAGYLQVPQLMQSETSLDESASYFHTLKLITNSEANRSNFLKLLPGYTIVTILSHARADSTDKEPMLFMTDSVIMLSELQLLRKPSTQLIVLSACQTNVGKIATGEGIISLARGFASAGIPSISATLWKADEKAIYSITEAFLQNISRGMRKDDALQKAKIAFMQNGSNERLLPFYWANMILAGNGEPINLSQNNHLVAWLVGIIFITVVLLFSLYLRKKKKVQIVF